MEEDENNTDQSGAAFASTHSARSAPTVPTFRERVEAVPLPSGAILLAVALVGVSIDVAFRHPLNSLITSVSIAIGAIVLFASGRLETTASKVLVGLAPIFGAWLTIRASSTLATFNILAALGLLIVGTGLAKRGRFFDYRLTWLLQSTAGYVDDSIMAAPYGIYGVSSLTKSHSRESTGQVITGLAIATPILIAVGRLLAAADNEFAALFDWFGATGIVGHIVLAAIGAVAALSLLRRAGNRTADAVMANSKILAPTTSLVIVLGFVALYGLFVATQLVDVLRTTFTHAEIRDYARSGFFQLLWVSVITLVTLMLVPSITSAASPVDHKRLRRASVVAIGLTMVITAMSVRRLLLFIEIDELTMLRLHSLVAAVAIGLLFILLAARLWGIRSTHDWFLGATISVALAVVLALNVANPEAQVARYNTQSTAKIQTIDMAYLGGLSTDAVPTLAAALDSLPTDEANRLTRALCRNHTPTGRQVLDYNHSAATASTPLKLAC